jgi:hypothetical protein
MANYGK